MKSKKETTEPDFVVDTRPLTKAEEEAISYFIKTNKEKVKRSIQLKKLSKQNKFS